MSRLIRLKRKTRSVYKSEGNMFCCVIEEAFQSLRRAGIRDFRKARDKRSTRKVKKLDFLDAYEFLATDRLDVFIDQYGLNLDADVIRQGVRQYLESRKVLYMLLKENTGVAI